MSKVNSVKFKGFITKKTSAITVDGTDGGRVTLEVPDTDIEGLAALILARNKVLNITVEWGDENVEEE